MDGARLPSALLAFGRPVLEQLPADAGLEARRAAVGTIVTVWNACVLAGPAWKQPAGLDQLRVLAASGYLPSPLSTLLEPLIWRWAEHHGDDARVVSRWALDGGPHGDLLHCEVQLPQPG